MTNIASAWWISILLNFMWLTVSEEQLHLAPLYWNLTGATFPSNAQVQMNAPLSSMIEIVCPFYTSLTISGALEYYLIYRVSQASFNSCNLYQSTEGSTPQVLVNCSSPLTQRSATITFLRYASVPGAVDFQIGQSYYYISTSSGSLNGLAQTSSGVCSSSNMRVAFNVVDPNSSSTSVSTTASSSAAYSSSTQLVGAPLSSSAKSWQSSRQTIRLVGQLAIAAFASRLSVHR